jgi:antitoxin component YwqK of YwqJK toxin-antitoxin module
MVLVGGNTLKRPKNGLAISTSLDDKQHGYWKSYYNSGQLKAEGIFEDNKMHGLAKIYYENGQVQSEQSWENGKKHGLWKFFKEDGSLKKTEKYHKDAEGAIERKDED